MLAAGVGVTAVAPEPAAKVNTAFAEVAGAETICAVTVSADAAVEVIVIEVAEATPTRAAAGVPAEIVRTSFGAACAETAENPPRVSATAATAAMRLKLVFVDIIFLSEKVDLKNFFISAWPFNTDS